MHVDATFMKRKHLVFTTERAQCYHTPHHHEIIQNTDRSSVSQIAGATRPSCGFNSSGTSRGQRVTDSLRVAGPDDQWTIERLDDPEMMIAEDDELAVVQLVLNQVAMQQYSYHLVRSSDGSNMSNLPVPTYFRRWNKDLSDHNVELDEDA